MKPIAIPMYAQYLEGPTEKLTDNKETKSEGFTATTPFVRKACLTCKDCKISWQTEAGSISGDGISSAGTRAGNGGRGWRRSAIPSGATPCASHLRILDKIQVKTLSTKKHEMEGSTHGSVVHVDASPPRLVEGRFHARNRGV